MKTQKGDFVEITYVGRLEDGSIFDLNDKEVAKKLAIQTHIHDRTVICLGERDVVPGLDDFLIDKTIGERLHVDISSEQGFGKKDPKKFSLVPLSKFKEQKINPIPGLRVEVEDYNGIIKSVSGGRVIVDFNHPLAGRNLAYDIIINKNIDSLKDKVAGYLEMNFHLHHVDVEEKENHVTIKAPFPKEMKDMLEAELKKRIPELQGISLEQPQTSK